MTDVLKRPAGHYREKTLVLCSYRYLTRDHLGTRWVPDALMIKVEFSDQIMETFTRVLAERQRLPWAPKMHEYEFVSYFTQNGKDTF